MRTHVILTESQTKGERQGIEMQPWEAKKSSLTKAGACARLALWYLLKAGACFGLVQPCPLTGGSGGYRASPGDPLGGWGGWSRGHYTWLNSDSVGWQKRMSVYLPTYAVKLAHFVRLTVSQTKGERQGIETQPWEAKKSSIPKAEGWSLFWTGAALPSDRGLRGIWGLPRGLSGGGGNRTT